MTAEPSPRSALPLRDLAVVVDRDLAERTRMLRQLVAKISRGLHPIEDTLIERNNTGHRIIAQKGKDYAGITEHGFSTIFYGLGGADVAGVRDFLPPEGGTVWSLGQENFTSLGGLRRASNPDDASVWTAKEQIVTNQLHGFYATPDPANQPLSGALGLAVNLAIAGIDPKYITIANEHTFEHNGHTAELTTLSLVDGQLHITWNIVSGLFFPREKPLDSNQLALVREIVSSQTPRQHGPVVAISKASHSRGVYGLLPFLQQQSNPVYVVLDNVQKNNEPSEYERLIPFLEDATSFPSLSAEYDWGYQSNPQRIIFGKLAEPNREPTGRR